MIYNDLIDDIKSADYVLFGLGKEIYSSDDTEIYDNLKKLFETSISPARGNPPRITYSDTSSFLSLPFFRVYFSVSVYEKSRTAAIRRGGVFSFGENLPFVQQIFISVI